VQVRNLRIGAMMRTVLPALAQAVFINSSPNFYHEGRVENLKEKLQVIISASCNGLFDIFSSFHHLVVFLKKDVHPILSLI
jgi:hypothetical protein